MSLQRRIMGDGGYCAVNLIIETGVTNIKLTVNSKTTTYTQSTVVEFEKGVKITWTATASTGYQLDKTSGTIENLQGVVVIHPIPSIKICTLTVTVNTGIQSITINNGNTSGDFSYMTPFDGKSSLTITSGTRTFSLPYGFKVTWSASVMSGYTVSPSSGTKTVTYDTSINPDAYMPVNLTIVSTNSGGRFAINVTSDVSISSLSLRIGFTTINGQSAQGDSPYYSSTDGFYALSGSLSLNQTLLVNRHWTKSLYELITDPINYSDVTSIGTPYVLYAQVSGPYRITSATFNGSKVSNIDVDHGVGGGGEM